VAEVHRRNDRDSKDVNAYRKRVLETPDAE
jgi:hypothetical protein